jgi:hypothetical protein
MKKLWISAVILLCLVVSYSPVTARLQSDRLQEAFQRPLPILFSQVAEESPLFNSAEEVERALLGEKNGNADRLKQKIAAVRMLMADGQIKPDYEVSYLFGRISAVKLVEAGEHWVMMAQAQEGTISDAEKTPAESEKTMSEEEAAKKQKEEECLKKDNIFDIGDCDEFNFFDIIAFPFRLIFFILEFLFNVILYPFKLLAQVIF